MDKLVFFETIRRYTKNGLKYSIQIKHESDFDLTGLKAICLNSFGRTQFFGLEVLWRISKRSPPPKTKALPVITPYTKGFHTKWRE